MGGGAARVPRRRGAPPARFRRRRLRVVVRPSVRPSPHGSFVRSFVRSSRGRSVVVRILFMFFSRWALSIKGEGEGDMGGSWRYLLPREVAER